MMDSRQLGDALEWVLRGGPPRTDGRAALCKALQEAIGGVCTVEESHYPGHLAVEWRDPGWRYAIILTVDASTLADEHEQPKVIATVLAWFKREIARAQP